MIYGCSGTVMKLHNQTGLSITLCKRAYDYCIKNPDATLMGFIRAKTQSTFKDKSFHERVLLLANEVDNSETKW